MSKRKTWWWHEALNQIADEAALPGTRFLVEAKGSETSAVFLQLHSELLSESPVRML